MRLLFLIGWTLIALCSCKRAAGQECTTDTKALPAPMQRGICYAHNYQHGGNRGYGSKTSMKSMAELKRHGVNWLSLTPFGFMKSLNENQVHPIGSYQGGETDPRMHREMQAAKKLGLKVMLKPHIWIAGGKWRGLITPSSWEAWFSSYETWILHYATMATEHQVPVLVIGVELWPSFRNNALRWRKLIKKIRAVYRGKITYAANWDKVMNVPIWKDLDYIGVQFYPPLRAKKNQSEKEMRARMARYFGHLRKLSKRFGKPAILTEVGYRSATAALSHPHIWPENDRKRANLNLCEQVLGYRILFDELAKHKWVHGVYLWKWFTDPNTNEEGRTGFSPRGKPALKTMKQAFARP